MSETGAGVAGYPGAPAALGDVYQRREPERSVLYQTLLEHTETFLAENSVPAFVARTFRHFLDCGMLPRGFLRVVCSQCKHESLVAFSCKDRGFCPSCTARRAAQTAAHLVDSVLPHVPIRQWVLAVPFDLHHRLARDAVLGGEVLAIFIDELQRHLREVTDADEEAQTGTFTATQHFGSSLNLHVHHHVVALDGVYEQSPDGTMTFSRAPAPTSEELTGLVRRVATRVRKLVGQPETDEEPISQAPALKIFGAEPEEPAEPKLAAEHDGFNLHAAVAFEAHERVAIERLCRYILRGPLALGRLTKGPRGNVIYRLKTPRPDGTTHIVLSPLALLQRLSWLCVLPRAHTTHYHGVLAPAHAWRALVVPKEAELTKPPLRGCGTRWIKWSDLLRRVFLSSVLVCQLCGGERRIIAQIDEGPVARKILAHLGLPSEPPRRSPARAPDQLDAWNTGPPAWPDADAEPPPNCDEWPPPDAGEDLPPAFDYDQRVPETDLHVA